VPVVELLLARAGEEFCLEEQALLFQRNDLPLGQPDLAFDRIHPQMQGGIESRAGQQDHQPSDLPAAGEAVHAALLAGADVRVAWRRVEDRALGLRSISAAPGRTARESWAKVGAGPESATGRCREPEASLPDAARRHCLTLRSSRLRKLTTARRPPARSSAHA